MHSNFPALRPLLMLSALMMVQGCVSGTSPKPAAVVVPEIRPGVAAGYLLPAQMPDGTALLPPPPRPDSAAFAADLEASELRKLLPTPRGQQATRDANLSFPDAARIFECALDAPVSEATTPRLYALLRRSRTDGAAVSDPAKDKYQRLRPFLHNQEPTCTPDKETGLSKNGSYPSGHSSIGWAWALILSEVAPSRADWILARGRSYGMSRVICNVHWQSDVTEGRFLASSLVARLHESPEFRADVAAARREMAALHALGVKPGLDCEAEQAALTQAGVH